MTFPVAEATAGPRALLWNTMGGYRVSEGVRRVIIALFATIAGVVVVSAILSLTGQPGSAWWVAATGVFCAAALNVCWVRLGPERHRSPVVSLPILVLPVLYTVVSPLAAAGAIVLGVLLIVLVRSRRVDVALYSAGLAGTGSAAAVAVLAGATAFGLPSYLAAGCAGAAYVALVAIIEYLRMVLVRPIANRTGPLIAPARLALMVLGCALLSALVVVFHDAGLAVSRDPIVFVIATLLAFTLVGVGIKLIGRVVTMRSRLTGLITGAAALGAAGREDISAGRVQSGPEDDAEATSRVLALLHEAVRTTIGVEYVAVRDHAARVGEISAPILLSESDTRFVVAGREPMGGVFTADDRSALNALARAAELAMSAHYNIGGLTARANTDPLTGLPNYRAFQTALANINDHRDYSEALAVLFLDLDDFKRLNDRHGHQSGDDLLRELGRRLRMVVRPSDVVARVGGDEFVVILTHLASLGEAKEIAERILETSVQPLTLGSSSYTPTLSIGLAYSAHRETDVSQLVQDADRAMLAIKKSRRRGGPANESSINISSHRSSQINDIIAHAIDEDLLELAFQPIVSLVTGQIWAFEALVRYNDPVLGPLSPPSIVEKAKGLGRMDALTRQVAVKAMAAAADFRLVEPRVTCMAINVEAGQIVPDRVGTFMEDLAGRYPGISLCLELNERSVARVTPAIRSQADRLRDLGLLIALDDYGSQDSSVDALVRMPMDILKIDRSLVDDLDDIRQREVLTALQGFGDNLEYSMIVEGVENEAMVRHLAAIGIRSAQGFHYGVPESFEKTLSRLERYGAAAVVPAGDLPIGPTVGAETPAAAPAT
ncbi:EAL domain-containing protein [Cryobacterium sp. 10S3]|uniref:EAL domain-containing protein n=2 Tax=unclassified Cryobacterium TaxID=2649013 RepID=UPI002B23BEFE|nr:EAL domain-containing protein [Cryobacterium sp. 10I1]MEB0287025.1 EAL domain-containing protein [Cryobacterium sp. 10S3]